MKTMLTRWLAFGLTSLLMASRAQAEGNNAMPYEETFGTSSNDYSILYNDTLVGTPPRNNGWWLGTSNDIANVTNKTFSYSAPGSLYHRNTHQGSFL